MALPLFAPGNVTGNNVNVVKDLSIKCSSRVLDAIFLTRTVFLFFLFVFALWASFWWFGIKL